MDYANSYKYLYDGGEIKLTAAVIEKLSKPEITGVVIKTFDSSGKAILTNNNDIATDLNDNYKLIKTFKSDLNRNTYKIYIDELIYGTGSDEIADIVEENIKMNIMFQDLLTKFRQVEYFDCRIADSLLDAILILDEKGYVKYYNKKALDILGIPEELLTTRSLQDFYHTKLKVMEVLKSGEPIFDKEIFVTTKKGEKQYLLKTILPIKDENGKVIGVIDKIQGINRAKSFINNLSVSRAVFTFNTIVHNSDAMRKTIEIAKSVSDTDMTVLIQGESGTGKELFAHAIHNASSRASKPFVILDCSTIPKELIESELFGYSEGAFTGAKKGGKLGKFELANGGTIFLDEIGEMSFYMQAKLLRVLQDGTFNMVGDNELMKVDIRVIAATNRNLEEEVLNKNFREDLFYRLNMMTINIPPLRERRDDIPVLADHFLHYAINKLNKGDIEIGEQVYRILMNYDWSGNVRQLQNAIFRAVNMCSGSEILPEHLPDNIINSVDMRYNYSNLYILQTRGEKKLKDIESAEASYILRLLKKYEGNKKKTAETLGISRSTLYRKLNKYHIQ